jgi:hypothetical protein
MWSFRRHPHGYALVLCAVAWLFCRLPVHAQVPASNVQKITIPSDLPLHVRVTHTAKLSFGAPVEGVLTEPVYVYDRIVLPKDSPIYGVVQGFAPVDHKLRTQAILDGDLTPLHDPVVNFNKIHLQDFDVSINSHATVRNTQLVRFTTSSTRPSLFQKSKQMVQERVHSTRDELFAPGKKDRALKLFYSQLPYHPQRIWEGTQFIANLTDVAVVPVSAQPRASVVPASFQTPSSIDVSARLGKNLSSDSAQKGDAVTAIVTKPVFTPQHQLLLPEGTKLSGTVLGVQPSRSFGRNGQLRFVFSGVQQEGEDMQHVHGTLIGAAGNASQNITVDQEGGVRSNPDKNRFVAPLLLGALAVAGHERDSDGDGLGRQTVAANGFGLVARVAVLTANDRNMATGFGAYSFAKSMYFRFLTRGHAVDFPKDTLVEVELSTRQR